MFVRLAIFLFLLAPALVSHRTASVVYASEFCEVISFFENEEVAACDADAEVELSLPRRKGRAKDPGSCILQISSDEFIRKVWRNFCSHPVYPGFRVRYIDCGQRAPPALV